MAAMRDHVLDSIQVPLSTPQALVATGVGALTFPIALGVNQGGLKYMKISTGTGSFPMPTTTKHSLARSVLRPILNRPLLQVLVPSAIGGLSVTLASLVASTTLMKAYSLSNNLITNTKDNNESLGRVNFSIKDLFISTATGVVFFRALGGRFRSVLPSHLHHPGAYARQWIPAGNHANNTQRDVITEIGRKYGCHSCGTRRVDKFFADHQPPTKFEKIIGSGRQNFYPHCQRCSSLQGGTLGPSSTSSPIITHISTLRHYYLFLPTPLLLLLFKQASNGFEYSGIVKSAADISSSLAPAATINSNTKISATEHKTTHVVPVDVQKNNTVSLTPSKATNSSLSNFPLFIMWRELTSFIRSFSPIGSFHMTLWAFSIIAAFGTL